MTELSDKLNVLRGHLRDGTINLRSDLPHPKDLFLAMNSALTVEKGRSRKLFRGVIAAQGSLDDYLSDMRKAFKKVAKASTRALYKNLISADGEVRTKEDFIGLAVQYRAMIHLLSEFRDSNEGGNFSLSSNLIPYHDPAILRLDLRRFCHVPSSIVLRALSSCLDDPVGRLERFSSGEH